MNKQGIRIGLLTVAIVIGVAGLLTAFFVLRQGPTSRGSPISTDIAPDDLPSARNALQPNENVPTITYTGTGSSSAQRVEVEFELRRVYQSLYKDAIFPIYQPTFVPAEEKSLHADAHVIGLAINGDAKAYPVDVLNSREMVNDVVGGVPVLVTW